MKRHVSEWARDRRRTHIGPSGKASVEGRPKTTSKKNETPFTSILPRAPLDL